MLESFRNLVKLKLSLNVIYRATYNFKIHLSRCKKKFLEIYFEKCSNA